MVLAVQVPSREVDKDERRFWTHWNKETKQVKHECPVIHIFKCTRSRWRYSVSVLPAIRIPNGRRAHVRGHAQAAGRREGEAAGDATEAAAGADAARSTHAHRTRSARHRAHHAGRAPAPHAAHAGVRSGAHGYAAGNEATDDGGRRDSAPATSHAAHTRVNDVQRIKTRQWTVYGSLTLQQINLLTCISYLDPFHQKVNLILRKLICIIV